MGKPLRFKPLSFALVLIFATSLASCAPTEETAIENLQIREANCDALAAWDALYNSESWSSITKTFNTYDTYAFQEKELWQKLQQGDPSFDALMKTRDLSYAQNYFKSPDLGSVILISQYSEFKIEDFPYSDEEQWNYIRNVNKFCPQISENRIAASFAGALLL